MEKAIFFDKDGVLNHDMGADGNLKGNPPLPEAASEIAWFSKIGFKIVVITNQPVVARGLMTETQLMTYLERYRAAMLSLNAGAVMDAIYYCPHHPNANVMDYRVSCECRKPKPGMILKACAELGIDIGKSYMVGDRNSDIIAGNLAGCRATILVSGKKSDEGPIETDLVVARDIRPDFVIKNISELRTVIQ